VPVGRRLAHRSSLFSLKHEVVPPDHFFCLGDHTTASVDSRELGPIPVSAILGRVQSTRTEQPRQRHAGENTTRPRAEHRVAAWEDG
jgi:hypothetical protein